MKILQSRRSLLLMGLFSAAIVPGWLITRLDSKPRETTVPIGIAGQTNFFGLVVNTSILDLGESNGTSYLNGEFQLKNTSNHTILLEKVETSCGCTTVSFARQSLDASASIALPVQVDPSAISGSFERYLYVTLDLPTGKQVFKLAVKGEVRDARYLVFLPGEIDFGLVAPGQSVHRRVHVRGVSNVVDALPREYLLKSAEPNVLKIDPAPTVASEEWSTIDIVLRFPTFVAEPGNETFLLTIRSSTGGVLCTIPIHYRFAPLNTS